MPNVIRPKYQGYTTPAEGLRKYTEVDPSLIEQAITAAAAINTLASRVLITGPASSTYAVTLAAPDDDQLGQIMVIHMVGTTATNAVTLALTNVSGGSAATSASFNAAAEQLTLMAVKGKWLVLGEVGVTLS